MNKLLFIPIAATLAGVISFGTAGKIAKLAKKNNDGSTAAITSASAVLPLDKIKMPVGFSISVYAEVAGLIFLDL